MSATFLSDVTYDEHYLQQSVVQTGSGIPPLLDVDPGYVMNTETYTWQGTTLHWRPLTYQIALLVWLHPGNRYDYEFRNVYGQPATVFEYPQYDPNGNPLGPWHPKWYEIYIDVTWVDPTTRVFLETERLLPESTFEYFIPAITDRTYDVDYDARSTSPWLVHRYKRQFRIDLKDDPGRMWAKIGMAYRYFHGPDATLGGAAGGITEVIRSTVLLGDPQPEDGTKPPELTYDKLLSGQGQARGYFRP